MAAIAANIKTFLIGPQDGWTQIVTGAVTPINFLRLSADPHTHPFFVFAGASPPAATVRGVKVCHNTFKVHDAFNGISSLFFVRITNPSDNTSAGKIYVDVYAEGGVLS